MDPLTAAGPLSTDQDPRWSQVLGRDVSADGAFVYAVVTTGVYCRPSCPSRRANPRNVRFFKNPAAAQAAGFRPCLRCQPLGPSPAERSTTIIAEACRRIEAADAPPKLDELASDAGMSPWHFHRRFKAVTGLTPRAYAVAHQARRVRSELEATESGGVTEAIYGAGFSSSSRFYERSDGMLGMTPTQFRRGGKDTDIRFAVGQCSLGAILVALSPRGICAISLGDDPGTLVRELEDRFPAANLIGGDSAFETLVGQVIGFVEAPRMGLGLPLDVRGTAFQQRVWQALRHIPAGGTATYADVAARIGDAKAVRAVARACAANTLAVAIPCHRVVRSDGTLSGYRWGVERKRRLLKTETEG
ncbi:bifunctional DNA-binding transcriptional regulator/O6-methylguanine-DNA methyltransferase Ada [Xanthobacter sp. YC-JY1]|uniref:bifunctional DNA-binding transcriptional regulator/O6-methylguanine-DNA methyltransferase Ada n=1 Tax=Xanthobacter sp. YC-JY1 TaxID=2419844 RepID=UPI001F02C631|nr:bifunctional DNA-binding transcriptional regulator/O6-methylguanine-DNA methyltransferase Ada [Xanthobacter sp. YC-JY1]UJX43943.1 bifunctional DNA-binding transcriptional regulator/O6-methylguanine-DNA methyltransferase Ada [Xanthobacter sp. YC-JY1]